MQPFNMYCRKKSFSANSILLSNSILCNMKNFYLLFWFLVWLPTANTCTNNVTLKKITSYLNTSDTAEKSKYMAEDFHSFFITKDGNGKNKQQTLQSFQCWDGPMHPEIKIISY